jgi:hypothetical protein
MNKLWMVIIVLLATPAWAQDDFGDFGGFDGVVSVGDLDALLGGGSGRGNRGGRGNNLNIPDPQIALNEMKDLLKANKAPLSKDQEKALKTLLETETKAMRESLEAQFANRNNNNNQNNRGNNQANMIGQLFTVVAKHNTELLTAMKADLTPEQLPLITKAEKDKKVCLVMLDLVNLQELSQRGGRGRDNDFFRDVPDRPSCTSASSTTTERLAPVAQVLSKGKQPLTSDQEKKFSALIEARVPQVQEELRATNPQMGNLLNQINNQNRNNNNNNNNPQQLRNNIVNTIMSQLGIPNNNNNNNRGNRGGNNENQNNQNANAGRGNRGNNNFNPQAEIQKKNEELLDKIAASLNPDQGSVVKKFKYAQIKSKGGAERFRGILEEEGTPLTTEQFSQIQALFNSQNQAIRQVAQQLVDQELARTPPQPESAAAQDGERGRNQNSVNQNPVAQQIVAKVLPQVSVQRARLEKVTLDTILKLLTPAQIASYKINSL